MNDAVKIDKVTGIGPQIQKKLRKNNIWTTYDLIRFFPRGYEHYQLEDLNNTNNGKVITVKGIIDSQLTHNQYSKVKSISFNLNVEHQIIKILAFNQSFLMNTLIKDEVVFVRGKWDAKNATIIANKIIKEQNFEAVKAIYGLDNIADGNLHKIFSNIFTNEQVHIYETLPTKIISDYQLVSRYQAFRNIHLPKTKSDYQLAQKRFKYEEAYHFQKDLISKINKRTSRSVKKYDLDRVKSMIDKIPYQLTNDQKQAVNDIFKDFKKTTVSYRLIQGDVGSGKTIVALIAAYGAITGGEQVAIMAPTELLAKQHYESAVKLFKDINIALLTSDTKNKIEIKSNLLNEKIDLIIGTQALIQNDVEFQNLGLVIIDEQHKFGVNTRNELIKKSNSADLIYLTATPIPRTLAISLFGDADISIIKEKPINRKPVLTKLYGYNQVSEVLTKIDETIKRNEKVYVVVPAIDSTHANYNIEIVEELLKKHINADLIGTIHGKLKKDEQNFVMDNFLKGTKKILLATTMIEVGIDVKDATLIVIFSAEYFGLSQLHQLRGRVGRSSLDSMCILLTDDQEKERLQIIEKVYDGFILSDQDLKLRGPGTLLGLEQKGEMDFKFLDFVEDYEILKNMRKEINKAQK